MQSLASIVLLLILLDMIFKPGRMSILAVVRPDSWNFPLFLHVLGAMILVGGLSPA
jgi:hypothetical protein